MRTVAKGARKGLLFTFLCVLALPAPSKASVTLTDGLERNLSLGFWLQPTLNVSYEPDGTSTRALRTDPELRHAQLLLSGQVSPAINFMLNVDLRNFGILNNYSQRYFAQDAFVEFNLHEAIQIDVGLLVLPFSHVGSQGPGTTLSLDLPMLTVPTLAGVGGDIFNRDLGIMARGAFANGKIDYRAAVTSGVTKGANGSAANPRALPRLTARLAYNVFDNEVGPGAAGYFYKGIHLHEVDGELITPKKILSFGISGGFQNGAVVNSTATVAEHFGAAGADAFLDYPLNADGTQAVAGQINYSWMRTGPEFGLQTIFAELGYRYKRIEPLAAIEWAQVIDRNVQDDVYWRGGINYWLVGHSANIKVDAGAARRRGGFPDFQFIGRVATQVLF